MDRLGGENRRSLCAACYMYPIAATFAAVPGYWGLTPPVCARGGQSAKTCTSASTLTAAAQKIFSCLLHQSEIMPSKQSDCAARTFTAIHQERARSDDTSSAIDLCLKLHRTYTQFRYRMTKYHVLCPFDAPPYPISAGLFPFELNTGLPVSGCLTFPLILNFPNVPAPL
jgi:hypothetical protein